VKERSQDAVRVERSSVAEFSGKISATASRGVSVIEAVMIRAVV